MLNTHHYPCWLYKNSQFPHFKTEEGTLLSLPLASQHTSSWLFSLKTRCLHSAFNISPCLHKFLGRIVSENLHVIQMFLRCCSLLKFTPQGKRHCSFISFIKVFLPFVPIFSSLIYSPYIVLSFYFTWNCVTN